MQKKYSFEGFDELIRQPLAEADPHSYGKIMKVLGRGPSPHAAPFSFLISRLVGKRMSPDDGLRHWGQVIELKRDLEGKLGTTIDIQTAAVEHFSLIERRATPPPTARTARKRLLSAQVHDPEEPGYHLERLRDELMRARRYSHALSAIMVEVTSMAGNTTTNLRESSLRPVVRIIEHTIRAVDVLTRNGSRGFLIILPDTNRREAMELADRIRANILERTDRMGRRTGLLLSSDQAPPTVSAREFVGSLQAALS